MYFGCKLSLLVLFSLTFMGCDGLSLQPRLTADAGSDLTLEPDSEVVLSGQGKSRAGDELSYSWHQPEGQKLVLSEAHHRDIKIKLPADSSSSFYTLLFTVTDQSGNSATDSLNITVKLPQNLPKMIADLDAKRLLLPVALDQLHQLQINIVQDRPANSDVRLLGVNGSSSVQVELAAAVAGDSYPVLVARKNAEGEIVEEQWQLVLTGLPIVYISAEAEISDEPKKPAYLTLIEPLSEGEFSVFTSDMGVEYRGNTSQGYAKKSLDIELWESASNTHHQAEERKVKLLGMRKDGDWILDAMYIDYARMRNRVSTDLWRGFAKTPEWSDASSYSGGTRGKLVEIVLNDQYHGVYMLTEQIDRKQLDLKDAKEGKVRGVLYKADLWGDVDGALVSKFEADVELPRDDQVQWHGWQLDYPKEPSAEAWNSLANLYRFVRSASDEEFKGGITQYIDLDNIIDYTLLLNVILGKDNQGKNTYFAVFDQTSTDLKDNRIYYIPWDMDGTWGRNWSSQKDSHVGWLDNTLLERIDSTNPDNYRERLKSRWQLLRTTHFSQANLMNRFDQYAQALNDSGAIERENARWGAQLFDDKGADLDIELERLYLEDWSASRLNWLDTYISENF